MANGAAEMVLNPELLSALSNSTPRLKARLELEALKLSALLKQAHAAGIDEDAIDNALDAPDARKAFISLILPHAEGQTRSACALPGKSASEKQVVNEVERNEEMNTALSTDILGTLSKKAEESGPSLNARLDEDAVIQESKINLQTLLKQAFQAGTLTHALEAVLTPEELAAQAAAVTPTPDVIQESKMNLQTLLKQACQAGTLTHALEAVLTPEELAAQTAAVTPSKSASVRSHGDLPSFTAPSFTARLDEDVVIQESKRNLQTLLKQAFQAGTLTHALEAVLTPEELAAQAAAVTPTPDVIQESKMNLQTLLKQACQAGTLTHALEAVLTPEELAAQTASQHAAIQESKKNLQTLLKQACQAGTLTHALEAVLTPEELAAQAAAVTPSTSASVRSHGDLLDAHPVTAETQITGVLELKRKLLSAQQQNAGFQESLREIESILEALRMDPASRADAEQLQKALEELHADFASRETEIARLKELIAYQEANQPAFPPQEAGRLEPQ